MGVDSTLNIILYLDFLIDLVYNALDTCNPNLSSKLMGVHLYLYTHVPT
jgi:hypothetical protein